MNDDGDLARRDDAARAVALDITRSCLVQAPAGSGKTSLLIQRFLALLAIVERPERIVATTFTRKAAAEMRARIVRALEQARDDDPHAKRNAHDAHTHRLAQAALDRDREMGWRLLDQPGRLRIVTLDALAAALARQAPLSAGLGALPAFVDDAQPLYLDAARAVLAAAPADDPHWHTFLRWQDNDAAAAARLIARMLAARDRWPARMLEEDADALRADVERVLRLEARAAVGAVRDRMPKALEERLPALAQSALDVLRDEVPVPAHATALEALCRDRALPGIDARGAWCALADWVLTRDGTFVQRPTRSHGFLPKGSGAQAPERMRRKAAFTAWLADASNVPGLADGWCALRHLPPSEFGDEAWAFVTAAMRILARAAGELESVFRRRGQADFTEGTLRALEALGAPEDPSALLLAIDYRLAHLLVDEFQDTSQAQVTLLARLTEGWEPGDGRTLFAVGDPMQSIYRFRGADVGLFLRAQAERQVGNVPVDVVELTRNFRSQRAIVTWVNEVFRNVLPQVSDRSRGEAAYRPSYADAATAPDVAPTLDLVPSRAAEAAMVVRRIRDAHAAGIVDIAVLVRARSHAQALLPALRRAGILYSAVDLEGLRDRLATRDALSLARALAQPADRYAWLSILRAPWCGLGLADLLAIADAAGTSSVLDALVSPGASASLSDDGRARVRRFLRAIGPALAARGQASFTTRVHGAWLALGGPVFAEAPLDRDGIDRVFALLARHERGGDLTDFETLAAAASRLFAAGADAEPSVVQVMTLHKAKGLQFGAVILPALDLGARRNDTPLLRSRVREHDGTRTFVLAPLRPRIGALADQDPVYRWLGRLDAAEEAAELGRLLYVGATRAKRRLHLVAVSDIDDTAVQDDGSPILRWKRPRSGASLERVWDALGDVGPPDSEGFDLPPPDPRTPARPEFVRLGRDWQLPELQAALPVPRDAPSAATAVAFDWADALAAAIGTVSHRLLAQVAAEGPGTWNDARLRDEHPRIVAELGSEGVERELQDRAAGRVADVVARTLRDPRGRWLFDGAHADAHSEWALAGEDEGRIVHIVVDRSFVADGVRYIVDFKTGAHLGGDPTAFLDREFERYRPQLLRYARIVGAIATHPVRIALFHPLVDGGWREEAIMQ